MNQTEIQQLHSLHDHPSVSILVPLYRRSPEDQQQNPVRVKNLVRQAQDQLKKEFSDDDAKPLLDRLQELADGIDYAHPQDGLALFASKGFSKLFYVPFRVEERVVVNDGFAMRDLLIAENRMQPYRVLVLSERLTRLFEGRGDSLREVTSGHFPLPLEMPGVATESPSNFGVEESALRNQEDRHYFIRVDKALAELPNGAKNDLPLVLVGIERDIVGFKEVSKHTDQIVATVTGRHRESSESAISELVWPQVQQAFAKQRDEAFQRIDSAIGAKLFAAGMDDVWRAAREGRVNTLVVEEHFHYPAKLSDDGGLLSAEDPTAPDVLSDAVDELINAVLNTSGQLLFVDDGSLEKYQHVAAVLRY